MNVRHLIPLLVVAAAAAACSHPGRALAHCDGLDGPVVMAARAALEAGDVSLILVWVRRQDEPEIRSVFGQAMAVRALGPAARGLADRHLFETLVRVHRAGEGAPYTGLKPAGRDLGPAIPAADRALETGSAEALETLLLEAARAGIRERFRQAAAGRVGPGDVAGGRRRVASYVAFVHYVERLYAAAAGRGPADEAAGERARPHGEKPH